MPAKPIQVPVRASLVAQTVGVLRTEIGTGRWRQSLPGEHELCALLHVSRVTLRAALAQLQREGWLRAAQGRRREVVAPRGQRSRIGGNDTRVVLLTAEPLQNLPTFAVYWIDALREHLSDAGFHLEVHVSRSVYGARSRHALQELTQTIRPAAWVLYRSTLEMQRWFSAHAQPAVVTGSRHPGVELPSVDRDYRATCRHATGLFIAKGHRRLVLINPESGTGGELESEQGFLEAVAQTTVPGVQGVVLRHDGSVTGICNRLDACFRKPEPPTALLVSRPAHVLTVVGHLLRRGLKLPQDVALISRDDDSFLEHVVPSVARYASNPSTFAQKLSKIVLAVAAGGVLTAADHRIMPHFVRGESFP